MTSASSRVRKGWERRRELYGPSGGNDGSGRVVFAPGLTCHHSHNTFIRHGCRCRWCCEAMDRHMQRWITNTRRILGGEHDAMVLQATFDDDTRITEATLRYHPPRAWVDAAC